MRQRFVLSILMLGLGATLLAAAGLARGSSTARKGGILRFTLFAGIESIDPQRSYYSLEWQYEWLTARPLLNFAHERGAPGVRLVNDGARSYTVSRNGRTYTFHLRRGMRFSDGTRITAANYEHALLRALHPNVGSPLAPLLTDPGSANIVGAFAYRTGATQDVPGIRARGRYKLVVKLTERSPLLPTLLAVPPAGAVSTRLPFSPITSVGAEQLPAGGRYYVQEYVPDRAIKIRKNLYYRPLGAPPTPGVAAGFDYDIGVDQDRALQLVESGQADWAADGLKPDVWDRLFAQYGSTGRVRAFTSGIVDLLLLNDSTGPFANLDVRKAIEWGIDRSAFAAIRGPRGAAPQCSLLSPVVPGYRKCDVYPNTPDLLRARQLASGHTHDRMILRYVDSTLGRQAMQLVTSQLNAVGFDNIDARPWGGFGWQYYDIALGGWASGLPDPYFYLNAVYGWSGSTFQDPVALGLLRNAAKLTGAKRLAAYGKLDLRIQREWAPVAVVDRRNDREFFSARLDPKSIVQSSVYGLDLGRLALR